MVMAKVRDNLKTPQGPPKNRPKIPEDILDVVDANEELLPFDQWEGAIYQETLQDLEGLDIDPSIVSRYEKAIQEHDVYRRAVEDYTNGVSNYYPHMTSEVRGILDNYNLPISFKTVLHREFLHRGREEKGFTTQVPKTGQQVYELQVRLQHLEGRHAE